jgi:1-acyl-sn-glycerol-3-phosphate acyltransferase
VRWIRKLVHGTAACLVTLGIWLTWLTGNALLWRSPRPRAAWRRSMFRLWGRSILRAVGAELTVVGAPPAAPGMLVANHLSYLDVPVLAACLPPVFVSKAEVRHWPAIGRMSRAMGTVFVQRERKRELPAINRAIAATLAQGDSIAVFPEGTSTNGSRVAPFRAPLLAEAARGGLPVHYATLRYETLTGDPPASTAVCWWGDMQFAPHVLELLGLRGIRAQVVVGADPVLDQNRKLLAEKLWRAVDQIFIPIA